MPACCHCNGVGHCINCSCSKLGRSCSDCLPLRRGNCQNKAVSQGSTSTSASASTSAVQRKGHGRNLSSATVPAVNVTAVAGINWWLLVLSLPQFHNSLPSIQLEVRIFRLPPLSLPLLQLMFLMLI